MFERYLRPQSVQIKLESHRIIHVLERKISAASCFNFRSELFQSDGLMNEWIAGTWAEIVKAEAACCDGNNDEKPGVKGGSTNPLPLGIACLDGVGGATSFGGLAGAGMLARRDRPT